MMGEMESFKVGRMEMRAGVQSGKKGLIKNHL